MRHSLTVDFRSSAVSQAAAFSRAIRDGNFPALPELLEEAETTTRSPNDPSAGASSSSAVSSSVPPVGGNIWWEPNSRGWTVVHVAAANSSSMSYIWWRWILEHAAAYAVDGPILEKNNRERSDISLTWNLKTDMGQTCIDLFLRTSLCPLPWQPQSLNERARRIRHAMESICDCPSQIEDLRRRLAGHVNCPSCLGSSNIDTEIVDGVNASSIDIPSRADDPVTLVFEFWQKLQLLLFTASCRQDGIDEFAISKSNPTDFGGRDYGASSILPIRTDTVLHLLSGLSWCPEIVGRLVLQLYPGQVQIYSEGSSHDGMSAGSLPLHRWSRTQSWRHCHGSTPASEDEKDDQNDPGIVHLLCQAYPTAASIPDPNNYGRLPLHSALVLGKPWDDSSRAIFLAHPDAIFERDPCSGLPCCCLPALDPVTAEEKEEMAKQQNRRLSLCWSYISQRDKTLALEQASALIDCQRLTTIYEVLRQYPLVVQFA